MVHDFPFPPNHEFFPVWTKVLKSHTISESTFSSLALYNKFSVSFTFLKVGFKVFWCDFCCFKEKWIEKKDIFGLWDLKSWCVCVYMKHTYTKKGCISFPVGCGTQPHIT